MAAPRAQLDEDSLWRILDVTRKLGAEVELDELLEEVVEAARQVLQADRGTVFLYDRESNELFSRVATGEKEIRFSADRGIAGEAAQSRQLLNIPDCYADDRFNQDIDRATGYRTRCLLTIPLIGIHDELVGVLQVLNKHEGVFDGHDERIGAALAAQCAVALQRARLIDEYLVKQKLERDLDLARDIQMRVLPRSMPQLENYEIAGWSRPADQTGGDIYDGIRIDKSSALLLLCDATGHGIGPALSVTQVRSMFRVAVRLDCDLDRMFIHVNDQLASDLAENRFVTAFVGILDAERHAVEYHAGGQGPMIHYRASDDQFTYIDASTIPMGIMAGLPADPPPPIDLGPHDILALISDGIFEQLNGDNEQYGAKRTASYLRAHRELPVGDLIPALIEDVERFAGGQPQDDDMTVVLVKRLK